MQNSFKYVPKEHLDLIGWHDVKTTGMDICKKKCDCQENEHYDNVHGCTGISFDTRNSIHMWIDIINIIKKSMVIS